MKIYSLPAFAVIVLFSAAPARAQVQDIPVQTAVSRDGGPISFNQLLPENATVRAQPGQATPPALLVPQTPKVTVPRKWNENRAVIRVPFQNTAAAALEISGVQSSGSLFVVGFPARVEPAAGGEIMLIYSATPGTNADLDVVRLLTNQGEKTIEVAQDREPVLAFDKSEVKWTVGEQPATKSVVITVSNQVTVPKLVHAYGVGNTAVLSELGNGQYRIDITPAATNRAAQFPVAVEFQPAVTGVSNIVQCSVVAAP